MSWENPYKKQAGVYILTNKNNGKFYCGESIDINHRMSVHRSTKSKQLISRAIRKHGWDAFTVEVHYLPNFDKQSLVDLEEQMIISYKSLATQNGYNVLPKGICTKGFKMSDETRLKMSISHTGTKKPQSDQARKNRSIATKGKPLTQKQIDARNNMAVSGEDNPNAKLQLVDVIEIRNRFKNGTSYKQLAIDYKIHKNSIWNIINFKTWNNV